MASSEVEICNKALARAGINSYIVALDNSSAEAASCRVLYPEARDTVLSTVSWPFALRRATLAPIDGEQRSGWAYVFQLPVDCLVPRQIFSGYRRPRPDQLIPYSIEYSANGRVICCDLVAPELEYTARVVEVPIFHPLFIDALTWHLAADLAVALGKDLKHEQVCRQRYIVALSHAHAVAVAENQLDPEPESELISIRGGSF